jgi:hypothetical protein
MGKGSRANLERLLQSAWERQQRPTLWVGMSAFPSRAPTRPRLLEYAIIRMGVPLAFAAIGIGLITSNRFLSGTVFLYLGLFLFAIDAAYESFFRRLHLYISVILSVIYLAAVFVASETWVFRAAPIEIFATSSLPVYGPGTKIAGIDWRSYYSDLDLFIKNTSAIDYDNFDAEVSTDLVIADLRELDGLRANARSQVLTRLCGFIGKK